RDWSSDVCSSDLLYYTKKCLSKNTSTHFGFSQRSVCKDDGNFYHSKTIFDGFKLHLNLKGIAHKFNFIQFYGLQHLAVKTNKTGRSVLNINSGNQTYIY